MTPGQFTCQKCFQPFQYASGRIGQFINCPSCGEATQLYHPPDEPLPIAQEAPKAKSEHFGLMLGAFIFLLAVIGAIPYAVAEVRGDFVLWELEFVGGALLAIVPWLIYSKLREIKTVLEQLRDKK